VTEEHKRKLSIAHMGKVFSEEHIKNLSIAHKGQIPWNTGKKRPDVSERNKKRIGQKHPFFGKKRPEHSALMKEKTKGENNSNWKGGVSFDEYPQEFDHKLKTQIRERDNYTCQLCMEYGNIVHHIDYNKRHCHPNNLITLCLKDNLKVNHNRTQWEIYFRLYMMFKKGQIIWI
jgi:hypothetical protein